MVTVAASATLEVVTSAFDYEQLEEVGVGEGKNSRVFRAFDPQLGGEIAVKEIPTKNLVDPGEYFREAQAMRRADCPNVVPISAASSTADRICLVMPYLKNGSLQARINKGPLPLKEVIRVGQGMLKGISQIHVANIIHFDVKPSNVLFSPTDEAMVSDFGQSRVAHAAGATPIPSLYIPAMPPETILFRHGDRQSDIYQAGVTLYRAVNGEPFYDAQFSRLFDLKDAICKGRFPDRDAYLPHVPRWLRLVINKAMKVDPAKRFQSASEFAIALGRHPIHLNWAAKHTAGGGMTWRAPRKNKKDIVVRDVVSKGKHGVEVFTVPKPGVLRAKDKELLWRSNLSAQEAVTHLRHLFRSLEQA